MMRRGDLLTVALPGDYGKPRPALVVQSDFMRPMDSVTLLPLTSEYIDGSDDFRVEVRPTPDNGLRQISYVMADKVSTVRRSRGGPIIGRLTDADMISVNRALAAFLGFA